jgi:hypothetical protein
MNPLAKIDEKSDIPPQVQMQLMASQKMVADLEQQIAALTLNLQHQTDVQRMKEEGQTKRKLMDVTSRAYNTETINEAKVNQTNMKSITDQNRTELDAITKLLLKGMDSRALQQEISRRDVEQGQAAAFAESEVNMNESPFLQQEMAIAQEPMVNPQLDDQLMAQFAMQEMQQQPVEQPVIPGVPMGPR